MNIVNIEVTFQYNPNPKVKFSTLSCDIIGIHCPSDSYCCWHVKDILNASCVYHVHHLYFSLQTSTDLVTPHREDFRHGLLYICRIGSKYSTTCVSGRSQYPGAQPTVFIFQPVLDSLTEFLKKNQFTFKPTDHKNEPITASFERTIKSKVEIKQ